MSSNCSSAVRISFRCCRILTSTKAEWTLRRSATTINIEVYVLIDWSGRNLLSSVLVYARPVIGRGAQQLSNYLLHGVKKTVAGAWNVSVPSQGRTARATLRINPGCVTCAWSSNPDAEIIANRPCVADRVALAGSIRSASRRPLYRPKTLRPYGMISCRSSPNLHSGHRSSCTYGRGSFTNAARSALVCCTAGYNCQSW